MSKMVRTKSKLVVNIRTMSLDSIRDAVDLVLEKDPSVRRPDHRETLEKLCTELKTIESINNSRNGVWCEAGKLRQFVETVLEDKVATPTGV